MPLEPLQRRKARAEPPDAADADASAGELSLRDRMLQIGVIPQSDPPSEDDERRFAEFEALQDYRLTEPFLVRVADTGTRAD